MTYLSASQRPIPLGGRGSDRVYRRHGFGPGSAARYRALGVPASLAKSLSGTVADTHVDWLASTFSVTGLRALVARNIANHDVEILRALSGTNLSTLRAYVSKTRLRAAEIEWLMTSRVPCREVVDWTLRLPSMLRDTNLVTVLSAAVIVHAVPPAHLAGWVRYANRHTVEFTGSTIPWTFLGGDTALMAAAGLAPAEADQMTRGGGVDRDALLMLAGLLAPSRGAR